MQISLFFYKNRDVSIILIKICLIYVFQIEISAFTLKYTSIPLSINRDASILNKHMY